jgi:hypothetical protein
VSLISVIPGQIFAQEAEEIPNLSTKEILELPKRDITFIKGSFEDLSDLEYTYTSNSKKYKVIESASADLTDVESKIYEESLTGEFELIADLTVNVEGGVVETTITPTNKEAQTVETFTRPSLSEAKAVEIFDQPLINTETSSITPYANNYPISDWYHYGNFFYSTKITKYTIAAVSAAITGIVSASTLGAGTIATITAINTLTSYIIGDQIGDIWYTDKVYYKTLVPPDPIIFRIKVAEKTTHTFYSDSSRTQHMKGSPIESEFWLKGYQ